MKPLSVSQRRALAKLLAFRGGDVSAYELGESLASLDALARRGLAARRSGLGSMFSPRTNIDFRITEAGVEHLKAGSER
jgi:hypothetical protein